MKTIVKVLTISIALLAVFAVSSYCANSQNNYIIKITVLRDNGDPVDNIKVYLFEKGRSQEESNTFIDELTTNSSGICYFQLDKQEKHRVFIAVAYSKEDFLGFSTINAAKQLQTGTLKQIINNKPTKTISGFVKNKEGNPINGAKVFLSSVTQPAMSSNIYFLDWESISDKIGVKFGISDKKGYYSFTVPEFIPDVMHYGAKKTGYTTWGQIQDVFGSVEKLSPDKLEDIVMSPSGSIQGRIVDANGKPIKALVNLFRSQMTPNFPLYSVWSNKDGVFIFEDIYPGNYRIAYKTEYENSPKPFDKKMLSVRVNEKTNVGTFEMLPIVKVSGKATNLADKKDIRIEIRSLGLNYDYYTSKWAEKNGQFILNAVPGKYELSLESGYGDFKFKKTKIIDVPSAGISDLVIDCT